MHDLVNLSSGDAQRRTYAEDIAAYSKNEAVLLELRVEPFRNEVLGCKSGLGTAVADQLRISTMMDWSTAATATSTTTASTTTPMSVTARR